MNKIKNIFQTKKKYIYIALPVLVLVLFLAFRHGKTNNEAYVVSRSDVAQSIVLSGEVRTSDRADLGFSASGRVGQIFVKNNQKVSAGQILAQLEIGDLVADLRIKEANARSSDIDLEASKEELNKVTVQENTKVENAYRALLSEN
ncbi:biotin/lipoyl-binding protein, partial [Patescibacteria group bacterium]|nr:biotin/lipoyl-binding protein [Patescibacteria group bacterium]